MKPKLSKDGKTIIIRVPVNFQRRGARKVIIFPEGNTDSSWKARRDYTLIKAIARAHRWKEMLATEKYDSLVELSEAEKINGSYLSRILRLTFLAPDIIESILDGRQPQGLSLATLLEPFPNAWHEQRQRFGYSGNVMAPPSS